MNSLKQLTGLFFFFSGLSLTGFAHFSLSIMRGHRSVNRVCQFLGVDVLRYFHDGIVSDALYQERR